MKSESLREFYFNEFVIIKKNDKEKSLKQEETNI